MKTPEEKTKPLSAEVLKVAYELGRDSEELHKKDQEVWELFIAFANALEAHCKADPEGALTKAWLAYAKKESAFSGEAFQQEENAKKVPAEFRQSIKSDLEEWRERPHLRWSALVFDVRIRLTYGQ